MANSRPKKATTNGRRKKANSATASRCTGAPAPRRSIRVGQKARIMEDEEMPGVEETPLQKVVITVSGESYDGYRDRVSATIRKQCNLLTAVVVLQRLPGICPSPLRFLSPELVLQMHRPHHQPTARRI